jgi:hypothetical protein
MQVDVSNVAEMPIVTLQTTKPARPLDACCNRIAVMAASLTEKNANLMWAAGQIKHAMA